MSFRVDIVTSEEEFASMRQAWDAMVFSNAGSMTVFQSWAYLFNHWKFRKAGDGVSRQLRLYVLYEDSAIVAVAPLWVSSIRRVRLFKVLEFIGTRGIDYLDFIVRFGTDPQKAVALLLESIRKDGCWDILSLSELRDVSANTLSAVLTEQGLSYHRSKCSTCVRIPLPTTWDEYRAQIGKSTRRHLNYEENRLDKLYTIEFVVHGTFTQEFAEALNALHKAHQQRWNAVGHKGAFHCDNVRLLDIEICKGLADNGTLCYFVLTANGIPAAGMACAVLGNTIYVHTMLVALETEFRNLSVGKVVLQKAIKWGIENGYSALDLLRGQEPYKVSFGGKAFPNHRITVGRNMLMTSLASLARYAGKPI